MLEIYGWSDKLQSEFLAYAAQGLVPGRVLVQQRGLYQLITPAGEFAAAVSGRFAHEAGDDGHPVAGDWVAAAARVEEGTATIHHILPRLTAFRRKAIQSVPTAQVVAANIDVALLLASLNADFSARRLERYLATAWESGAKPVIVLTKLDACADARPFLAEVESMAAGTQLCAVSALTGEGLDALRAILRPGLTAVLLGSSGVGKSTLVNALAGEDVMSTQEIRAHDARGRHTTTHRELILLPQGGLVLDTPGMRELGLWEAEAGVSAVFADIEALTGCCRFRDCSHELEPGCAVRAAIHEGSLDAGRWLGYRKLKREAAHEAHKHDPAASAERRKTWVRIARVHRDRKKRKWDDA